MRRTLQRDLRMHLQHYSGFSQVAMLENKRRKNPTMVARDEQEPSTSAAARRPAPSHPPYALMIGEAIRSLDEGLGSMEPSISEYIRGNFEGLPWGHDKLLPYYLHKLTGEGEFVKGDGDRYQISQDDDDGDDAAVAEEEDPDSLQVRSKAQLFEERVADGEGDVEALQSVGPAPSTAEKGIADNGDGDSAWEPEPPMFGDGSNENVVDVADPFQGESEGTENVEPEPPLLTEDRIENQRSVDVADPLESLSVLLACEGTNVDEDGVADPLESQNISPVCEGENVDGDGMQTLQSIAHAAEEPAPPALTKECTMFVVNQNFEDGLNNEERIYNDAAEPLQSIVLTPSQPETEGAENDKAIANVNDDDDDEGVPIACEGDLVMEVQPLAIFLGPVNELGGNSELVHELSRMSLMEPQEAESAEKKNDAGEGSEPKPKRRGRPPKGRTRSSSPPKRRTCSSSIVAQDGALERNQRNGGDGYAGDVVVQPLQALVPH